MSFRLVRKSVTLNDLERHNVRLFCVISANWVAFDEHCLKVVIPKFVALEQERILVKTRSESV